LKNISKYKVEANVIIPIVLFFIISIVSIYSTRRLLSIEYANLWIKQIVWYVIGLILAFSSMIYGNKFFYNNAYIFYIIGVISLILVLFFGVTINNATCWFKIPLIGTFQPSEFMKIFLILTLSRMINDFNEENSNPDMIDELKFILKVLVVLLIPSILTFIEPDTGAVIMYVIITAVMLFVSGLRKRWFILTGIILITFLGLFFYIYYFKQDLFIDIFGTSFFYRMDRITNFVNSSGMQLENSLIAIGSSGTIGHGINNTPIYFPEMQTDFIFAVYASNTGFIGGIMLIFIILFFDLTLIGYAHKTDDYTDKYAIGGIIGVLIFQQMYNIAMTIGLVPIMGITLPFISYGGSSLLSYMLLLGIIFNVSNESLRFTN
jgi:rod shape determining protein RodA